jgi:hypothetical protein
LAKDRRPTSGSLDVETLELGQGHYPGPRRVSETSALFAAFGAECHVIRHEDVATLATVLIQEPQRSQRSSVRRAA